MSSHKTNKSLSVTDINEAIYGLQNNSIKGICLQGQALTDRMLQPLFDLLKTNQSLLYLDLRDNKLTDVSALNLIEAMENNVTLSSLYLYDNAFTEVGIAALKLVLPEYLETDLDDISSRQFRRSR